MVRKPGKILCYMFLFAILGFYPAQNLAKYKRWITMCANTNNE